MILLDTCALLWLAAGNDRISPSVRNQLDNEQNVAVSAVSALEIGLKVRSRKLNLPLDPLAWWEQAIEHHRLAVLQMDAATLLRSTELPYHHRDPADRIIIASALIHRVPVVTGDSRFKAYGVSVIL